MQNYCKTIGALVAASALVAGNASAEIEYEIHTGYTSQYVFRGLDLGDNLVEFGLDMATEYNGVGLSYGLWAANVNNAGTGNPSDNEVDFYTEASYDFGYVTGAIGYIYYWNVANFGSDAGEVYFSVSKELYGIDTSFTYFWDVHAATPAQNEGYSEFYFGKSFELSPCLTLNSGLTIGFLWEGTDVSHVQWKVGLDWAATETATISPFIAYSWDGSAEAGSPWINADDEFFAGSMLSVSF